MKNQTNTRVKGLAIIFLMVALTMQAAGATSASSSQTYTLPVAREWGQTELLVLIVPPTPYNDHGLHVQDGAFRKAVQNSITLWEDAIIDHGSAEISANVRFDVRVLGSDPVAPVELADVDIIITNHRQHIPFVSLGGVAAMQGNPCIIGNTPPVADMWWAFRISIHEFGHCLGLGHPSNLEPDEDVMAYGTGVCISNLDLLGLHESFGPAFGRTPAANVQVSDDDYERYC